jgi:hydrogenase-4 component E
MINYFIILFGVMALISSATNRIQTYIKILSFQGFILFLLILGKFSDTTLLQFAFLVVETLVVKTFLVPYLLLRTAEKNQLFREKAGYISNFYSLLITSVIFAAGLFAAYWPSKAITSIHPIYFGISISTILTGLFIILIRRKIITHLIAYIVIENGIFLLSLAVLKEMPLIVNIGVLLELFVVVFLFRFFLDRIRISFKQITVDRLSNLKD